jgi:hypothetical protein
MKQKKYLILAATAALFAACTSDESPTAPEQQVGEVPVLFDGYVNRGTTRAGQAGEIKDAELATAGFGVFAYYTDNNDYDQYSIPNFMYNQKVTKTGTGDAAKWTYEPVKYWPNEYGANATSEDCDRVTFFAYAPYVAVTANTGKVTGDADCGIVGLSRNTAAGDPMVKYIASFDATKAVDLLWGVVGTDETSWTTKETTADATPAPAPQTLTKGFPWLNVKRAGTTTQKVKFTFDHALAKLNVTVDAFVDGTSNSLALTANSKIFIRSITFTGFASKGALNLNNADGKANVAKWYSFSGANDIETGEEITIYDGRKDGKEGTAIASSEKVTGLNPALIEEAVWEELTVSGVTNAQQNLFSSTASTDGVYVIPTGEPVNVTIVYEVETEDTNLPTFLADGKTHGSKIKNTITKAAVFDELINGKCYTLNLHLGMNSVKFDATVGPWDTTSATGNVNLPEN